jgi:hypothetical protein
MDAGYRIVLDSGDNVRNQISYKRCYEDTIKPIIKRPSGVKIESFYCADYNNLILTKAGVVYGNGDNTSCKLGLTDTFSSPTVIQSLNCYPVISITSETKYCFVLIFYGRIFGCRNKRAKCRSSHRN